MNPILSHHYPLCYARVCRFPYVGKISVGEEDVNFVYQFVKKNDTEYKKNIKCIKYEDHYITGIPIKFPNYEDFQQAFSMVYIFPDIIYYCPVESNLTLHVQHFVIF